MTDFYDAPEDVITLGPIFVATYESDSSCCRNLIEEGDRVRADGSGGWCHADAQCERVVLGDGPPPTKPCTSCFTYHAGECA